MQKLERKVFRCAIYTRKSTEHNLDLEFNSLDAQREACEAYIKSQAHEGWRPSPGHYDDGAFSGASLERPALQQLLTEIRSGKIDIIVVYKVDRLTRALADFAKLVELFDQHAVSFVSVTQSFNTTSSMGRLTLNVLLSFAQFEREVIGERVRDKIAASKRKGIWVGGPIPLGYKSVDKKLVIVPENAERVRMIFSRYLKFGSIGAVVEDLHRRGIRTTRRKCDKGPTGEAVSFSVGAIAHILKNRFYVGEVVYRGEVSRGNHETIIEREQFEAVQGKLASAASIRRIRVRGSPAILAGRIFDDRGNRMTPTHANKNGVRYRYYVSHALLQKRGQDAGSVRRVPGEEIERAVLGGIRERMMLDGNDLCPPPASDREMIERHLERVAITSNGLEGRLVAPCGLEHDGRNDNQRAGLSEAPQFSFTIPWSAPVFAAVKGVVHSPTPQRAVSDEAGRALLAAIAKARMWIYDLVHGRVESFAEIAKREGKVERHIRYLAPLAFVSPEVISMIAERRFKRNPTMRDLVEAMSDLWIDHRRLMKKMTWH